MHYRKQQGGMGFLGWIFVLGLLAVLTLATLRLFPIYLEYFKVKTSLEALAQQSDLQESSKREIRHLLLRRLDINEVEHVSQDNIEITRGRDAVKITVDYEVRTPFLGNVDLVAHFNRITEVPLR